MPTNAQRAPLWPWLFALATLGASAFLRAAAGDGGVVSALDAALASVFSTDGDFASSLVVAGAGAIAGLGQRAFAERIACTPVPPIHLLDEKSPRASELPAAFLRVLLDPHPAQCPRRAPDEPTAPSTEADPTSQSNLVPRPRGPPAFA